MSTGNTSEHNNEVLETQAKKISSLLDAHSNRLSMRTLKQLEDSRARAVTFHTERTTATVNADGSISHLRAWIGHHRFLFGGLMLVILMSAFLFMKHMNTHKASDAYLLSADLPLEALVDTGFEPTLNNHKKYR